MNTDYDLIVIGAGSGGVRAARMCASHGAKVAIIEEYRVGGTCVIRGCIPKKLYVYASHYHEDFQDAAGFGWEVPTPSFNWHKLRDNKDTEIQRLNDIYTRNLKASGVDIIEGRGILTGPDTVDVGGRLYQAKTILVAVGAAPFVPDIPGHEHIVTSNEAFDLEQLPSKITIVGGGYIAVEFAGIFNGLGVETELVYRGNKILRGFDDDIRVDLGAAIQEKGIKLRLEQNIAAVVKTEHGFDITFENGETGQTGLVMYATGRVPYTQGLGLEAAGVALGKKGEIVVDPYSKTNVHNIYAVGDVTDRAALTPIAIREGAAFAETVFNNNPQAVDHSIIPTAVFSQPEIGTVGLSEEDARLAHKVLVYKARFRPLKNTLSGNSEKMLMKLIVDQETDRVLGLHIIGPGAGEMIQAFGIAVTMGATKAQFDATVAVHPTAAEEMVTFKTPEAE